MIIENPVEYPHLNFSLKNSNAGKIQRIFIPPGEDYF